MIPKMLALDLDETTLDENSRLSPETRRALEAAIAGASMWWWPQAGR